MNSENKQLSKMADYIVYVKINTRQKSRSGEKPIPFGPGLERGTCTGEFWGTVSHEQGTSQSGSWTQAQNSVKKVLTLATLQRPTLALSDAY